MLFITGIKHSGKTTFASLLAKYYHVPHIDSDVLVKEYLSIDDIRNYYIKNGKGAFMKAESASLSEYLDKNISSVISLGGGACDNDDLIDIIKEKGRIVYLYRKEKDLLSCILKDGIPPFLDKNNINDSFHDLFDKRDEKYRKIADLVIDLGPYSEIDSTFDLILENIRSLYVR